MLEKLLLAASITFSLNMFLQVQAPLYSDSESIHPSVTDTAPQILVKMRQK